MLWLKQRWRRTTIPSLRSIFDLFPWVVASFSASLQLAAIDLSFLTTGWNSITFSKKTATRISMSDKSNYFGVNIINVLHIVRHSGSKFHFLPSAMLNLELWEGERFLTHRDFLGSSQAVIATAYRCYLFNSLNGTLQIQAPMTREFHRGMH